MFIPLLAAETPSMGTAAIDALITVLVVFAVLCVLSSIIWLFGRVGDRKKRQAADPAPQAAPPAPAPAREDEEGDEVIAAIGAAVAMMAPAGKTYQITKITPVREQGVQRRSEWAAAAVRQNTAPF